MIDEIQALLDDYHQWLADRTALREVGDWVEITTPYLDRHNDCLQIYVRGKNGAWELSDGAWTIHDLNASGMSLDTPKRKALLELTLRGFGVELEDEALVVHATRDNFPFRKHGLVQAMLAVNDLFALSSPTVTSVFLEDVQAWLDSQGVRYSPHVPLIGRSGFTHMFDFLIPKSPQQPERVVKAINRPDKDSAQSMIFAWLDSRDARPAPARAYALLNDEDRPVSANLRDAFRTWGIVPVTWSDRARVIDELAA